MCSLRHIFGQGKKRLGLLVGAGAPAGMPSPDGSGPLIPAVNELTNRVLQVLEKSHGQTINSVKLELEYPNIENILTRVRSLAGVIGDMQIHGLNGQGFHDLSNAICSEIGKVVNQNLPDGPSPYSDIVNWIAGTDRDHAVEIFTTNYDILFEQALERAKVPFFDGFSGSSRPFFDPSSIASNDLPSRWVRVWKMHGSIGWATSEKGEVIRDGHGQSTHCIFPEYLKYDRTQKAPYAALFDRLRSFLMTPDTLLIATGFSFGDAHVSACIDECLAANPSTSVFAFQFKKLAEEAHACEIASRRANMSVYSPDRAIINAVEADWVPGDPPTRDWMPIRASYWGNTSNQDSPTFLLGQFDRLARFFVSSRSTQILPSFFPAHSVSN